MRKLLVVINIILFAILVFILSYPRIQAAKIKEIKVIYTKNVSALPLFVALENGYFDSLKLKASLEEVDKPGDEVERVGRGALGAGFGTSWDLFALKASASPEIFRVIYNVKASVTEPQSALVSPKNRGIRSFRDLTRKGVRIGYLKDSRQMDMIKYVMATEKVREDNYTLMPFSYAEMKDTNTLRFVDAMLVMEPLRTYLIKKNLVNVVEDGFLERRILTPFLTGVGYTSRVNVQLNKEGVARLAEGLNKAIDYIRKDPQSAQKILRKYIEIEDTFTVNLPTFEKYSELTDVAEINRTVQKYIEMQVMFREVSFGSSILRKEEIQK
jgi:ABC-type nitrate/sulfonate/bicarbonate transport system substrate-binding protein